MTELRETDPRQVGPFTLTGRLGGGATGTIYLGRTASGRLVAVKVVHEHLARASYFRERFAREVEAYRRVQGPSVAMLVDADTDGDLLWSATRYIAGPSLWQRVNERGPLDAGEVFALGAGIAEALRSIHAAGLVHRNLKPSVVILAEDGPHVVGLDLARVVDSSSVTRVGIMLGTFEYLSPEQASGDVATTASDVFALGGLLHYAATGRPPFGTGHPAALIQRVMVCLPDLGGIGDDRLRRLTAACLTREPDARPTPSGIITECAGWRGDTAGGEQHREPEPADHTSLGRRVVLVGAAAVAITGVTLGAAAAFRRLHEPAKPSLRHTLNAHRTQTTALSYAPDGSTFATGETDGTVRIWTAATAAPVRVLRDHFGPVQSVAHAPDGRTLVSVGDDADVRVWDCATGRLLRTFRGHTERVNAVAFARGGRTFATASSDETVRVWDVATGTSPLTLTHPVRVLAVAYAPDGATLATAGADGVARIWRADDGSTVRTLTGHREAVLAVAFAPDGRTLATGSTDATTRLWDPATGIRIRTIGPGAHPVQALAFAPRGQTLATGALGGAVRVRDVASGRAGRTLTEHQDDVLCLAFAPDGAALASTGADGTVRVVDPATGALKVTRGTVPGSTLAVAFSPDGSTFASSGYDRTLRLWETATGKSQRTVTTPNDRVNAMAYTRDGKSLLVVNRSGAAQVRSASGDSVLRRLVPAGGGQSLEALAVSPDGRQVVTGGREAGVRLWDLTTGRLIRVLQGHDRRVTGAVYLPDGNVVATAGWDRTVRVWAVPGGTIRYLLAGHEDVVLGVTASPDGRFLASCGRDGTVRLWETDTGRLRRTLTGHTGAVLAVAFAPSGRTVASAGRDRTVRIWDAWTGEPRTTLATGPSWVTAVAYDPKGRVLAAAGNDGTIRLWGLADVPDLT